MKLPAFSFPNLAILLAGSHVAQVVVARPQFSAPSTVALTTSTHTVTAFCQPSTVTLTRQGPTVTDVVTHTSTLLKASVTSTVTDLITRTSTVTKEPTTYTTTQTVFPPAVTRTVTDTVTQSPATSTITFTVTSLQSPTASQCTAVSSTSSSTPALSGIFFSPYKDTSINMDWNTDQVMTDVLGTPQLAFVAATDNGLTALTFAFATGECGSENWAGVDGAVFAQANVADWINAGPVKFMLSTGGAAAEFTCGSDAGMETFLSRFASSQLEGVDFWIVGGQNQSVINDLVARVQVSQSTHPNLRFSFSITSLGGNATQILDQYGQDTMSAIQNAGLTDYYINVLAMDYGTASAEICVLASNGACDMAASAIAAATNLHNKYHVPYNQIELTVMIGGNDVTGETFTLMNADTVAAFVLQNRLGGLHFWSFDRDVDCPPGAASPTCNTYGVAGMLGFTKRFLADGV
jgi:chitinase